MALCGLSAHLAPGVHAESAPRLRPERWVETHSELQVWTRLQEWRRNVRCSVMPERHQPAQHCVGVGSRNKKERMQVPDTINGFEVHKPLDALLEEPDPSPTLLHHPVSSPRTS